MTTPRTRDVLLPALAAVLVAVVALLVARPAAVHHESHRAATAVRSGHVTVSISNYAYSPDTITVKAGTRVTWVNHDPTAHTATANGGAFDTGTINRGHRHTITLSKPGTYPYHCVFHAFMTGTVTVVAS